MSLPMSESQRHARCETEPWSGRRISLMPARIDLSVGGRMAQV